MNKLDKKIDEVLRSNQGDGTILSGLADYNENYCDDHIKAIKATILKEIKKEMPLNIPKTLTDDNIPDWLKYGVVCEHDDWTMCGHRANYLITTLEHLLGETNNE